jgi:hypothetical protein
MMILPAAADANDDADADNDNDINKETVHFPH